MIEWTRLSADQVEELSAVLLCRENPNATRIRPSRGDGGIDILAPSSGSSVEIYQVKSFTSNLNGSQKSQIASSIKRLEDFRIQNDMNVDAWHLLVPLDPTKENLSWLRSTTQHLPYTCHWRGLSFLDGLAAKFPEVVDYYVGNGRKRIEDVVTQMTTAMGLKPREDDNTVSPDQLADYIGSLAHLLDGDPHFRYEVSVGPHKSYMLSEPGMVVATQRTTGQDPDSVVTVRVFSRYKAATTFRPIPFTVRIRAEDDTELSRELDRFINYGTSLSVPAGHVEVDADLPGGLGGKLTGGSLRIISANELDNERSHVLRLAVIDPHGAKLSTVLLDMRKPTTGFSGTRARVTGTERSGAFHVEILTDTAQGTMKLRINSIATGGLVPEEVAKSLRFLVALRAPNRLAFAAERGPLEQSIVIDDVLGIQDFDGLHDLLEAAESLAVIQDYTNMQLVMPQSITNSDIAHWRMAKQLLLGDQVQLAMNSISASLHPGTSAPAGKMAILIYKYFAVSVGSTNIRLGTVQIHCPIAETDPTSVVNHGDHIGCSIRSADGSNFTARLAPPDDLPEAYTSSA